MYSKRPAKDRFRKHRRKVREPYQKKQNDILQEYMRDTDNEIKTA